MPPHAAPHPRLAVQQRANGIERKLLGRSALLSSYFKPWRFLNTCTDVYEPHRLVLQIQQSCVFSTCATSLNSSSVFITASFPQGLGVCLESHFAPVSAREWLRRVPVLRDTASPSKVEGGCPHFPVHGDLPSCPQPCLGRLVYLLQDSLQVMSQKEMLCIFRTK